MFDFKPNYKNFPSPELLIKVIQEAPHCCLLYLILWDISHKKESVSISKKDPLRKFNMSRTLFRNRILLLEEMGLVIFSETSDEFKVTLIKHVSE